MLSSGIDFGYSSCMYGSRFEFNFTTCQTEWDFLILEVGNTNIFQCFLYSFYSFMLVFGHLPINHVFHYHPNYGTQQTMRKTIHINYQSLTLYLKMT